MRIHSGLSSKLSRCLFAGAVLLAQWPAFAADYYVSLEAGSSDNNPGTQERPWHTIAKVNKGVFNAGDRILFRGGDVFSGNGNGIMATSANCKGNATTFVTFTSYPGPNGSTATISCNSTGHYHCGFNATSVAGILISNLKFAYGTGLPANDTLNYGIYFHTTDTNTSKVYGGVHMDHVDVSGFQRGVVLWTSASKAGAKWDDVNVTYSRIHDNTEDGMRTLGNENGSGNPYSITNLYVGHCAFYNNAGFGLANGNGIVIGGADGTFVNNGKHGALIERCVAYGNGHGATANGGGGIWCYYSKNLTIQHCISHENYTNGPYDGLGFDLDWSCQNCILQYNYSYQNTGAGVGLYQIKQDGSHPVVPEWCNNIVRYNFSQNDGIKNSYGGIIAWDGGQPMHDCEIYNNTVYTSKAHVINGTPYCWRNTAGQMTNCRLRNNIFMTPDCAVAMTNAGSGTTYDNNNYYVVPGSGYAWHADGHANYSNPLMYSAGTANSLSQYDDLNKADHLNEVDAFKLHSGSPMIDAGLSNSVFSTYGHTGAELPASDFFGSALPQLRGCDIGAHEFLDSKPAIFSAANATPNPAKINQGVEFSVGAAGFDGATVNYSWNFGDGSGSGQGSTVSHAYTTAGVYSVLVTVTDAHQAAATSSLTVTVAGSSRAFGWQDADIGAVAPAGSASVESGVYTVSGAGADIWGSADAFNFVYWPLNGDGQIVARVNSVTNTHAKAKGGVMIRETLTAGSKHALLDAKAGGGVELISRAIDNAGSTAIGASGTAPVWLQLVRQGATISANTSTDGLSWTPVGSTTIEMAQNVYIGLAVCSHNASQICTAVFDRVVATSAWVSADIGSVGQPGSANFSAGVFTLSGSGADVWGSADGFRFCYMPLSGDGEIVAHVSSVSNSDSRAKGGLMIRESISPGAMNAFVDLKAGGGAEFIHRLVTNGGSAATGGSASAPAWLKLTRANNVFTAYTSADGAAWTEIGSANIPMQQTVLIGLAVCSHDNSAVCTSAFDNVNQ